MKKLLLLALLQSPFLLSQGPAKPLVDTTQYVTYTTYLSEPQVFENAKEVPTERFHLFMPGVAKVNLSDKFGENETPRWTLTGELHPAWLIKDTKPYREYISIRGYVDLDNELNANPNSINLSIQTNLRNTSSLNRRYFRDPELNSDIVGFEYDYSLHNLNYISGADILEPFIVLHSGMILIKGGAGMVAGHRIKENDKTNSDPILRMTIRGQVAYQTNDGFSITAKLKSALPFYDEPETIEVSTTKKPTITYSTTPRHYFTMVLAKKMNAYAAMSIQGNWGELPPSFWNVKPNVTIGILLTSGGNKSE
jgi:hypothetical protein